jgi:predicted unusual protein kinase regulating ubiquinone biosynthesis (AarF/ABC1/UbiB family)
MMIMIASNESGHEAKQVHVLGLAHADLHAGNVLVRPPAPARRAPRGGAAPPPLARAPRVSVIDWNRYHPLGPLQCRAPPHLL